MGTDYRIRPVTTRRDLKRFIDFPYRFYRESTFWIPPLRMDQTEVLNPKKNPFFEHGKIQCFLAEKQDGEIIGRIAGIVNGMHLEKYQDGNGFFGFFECENRQDVASSLFDAARDYLLQQGLSGMRGPTNPSMNDVAGLLVKGFNRYPSIMMPYNMPYYENLILEYGFEKAMTMWAYFGHYKMVPDQDRYRRGVEIMLRRNPGLKVRTLDMKRFEEEARTILRIYNDAWSNNWGHVPMTDNEFAHLAKSMKQVVDPEIVYFLELDGEPVAFSVSLPDINLLLRHVKDGRLFPTGLLQLLLRGKFSEMHQARTLLMGVLKKYQGRGFDALLNGQHIFDMAEKKGYYSSEMSWVLDSNPAMVNAAERIGGVRDKEYAMYEVSFTKPE